MDEDRIIWTIKAGFAATRAEAIEFITHRKAALQHQLSDRENGCPVCDICKGVEGSLTTDCSGSPIDIREAVKIFRGELDFYNGEWMPVRRNRWPGSWGQPKIVPPPNREAILDMIDRGCSPELIADALKEFGPSNG